MISLTQLWIPIVVSAVVVFVASSVIHMVIKWHNADFRKLANEDEVRTAIRNARAAPGLYVLPHCTDPAAMQAPDMKSKFTAGPVGLLTLRANAVPEMGRPLVLWFLLNLVISIVAGYLASRTLPSGASFTSVFRLVSTVSFVAYVSGSVQNGIWMGKPWPSVTKDVLDGLIYGCASAAVFAWLWPH